MGGRALRAFEAGAIVRRSRSTLGDITSLEEKEDIKCSEQDDDGKQTVVILDIEMKCSNHSHWQRDFERGGVVDEFVW